MTTTTLFRPEVADAWKPGESSVRLVMPLGYAANAALLAGIAAGLLLLLFFGRYTARDTVRGYVTTIAGNVEVYASSSGTIRTLLVAEGDHVSRGDTLAVVDAARADGIQQAAGESIAASLHAEHDALIEQIRHEQAVFVRRGERLQGRLQALLQQQEHIESQVEIAQQRLAIAEDEQRRLQALNPAFASANDRDRARHSVLDRAFRAREVKLLLAGARADIHNLRQQLGELPAEKGARIAELVARSHRLSATIAERESRSIQKVLAPSPGVVSGLLVRSGQTVSSSSPLMNLVPEDRMFMVELLVPTHSIGFVRPAAPVNIRYDAFPYQKFGVFRGTVANLTQTTVLPGDQRFRVAANDPVYLARVRIDEQQVLWNGQPRLLQAGMTLTADILRDERRIIEWLFDPLLGATGRL